MRCGLLFAVVASLLFCSVMLLEFSRAPGDPSHQGRGVLPSQALPTYDRAARLEAHESNICTFFEDGMCHRMHVDYFGQDVGQVKTDTAHECQLHCAATEFCNCFTWKPYNLCFMKDSCNVSRLESSSVSGPKSCKVEGAAFAVPLLVSAFYRLPLSSRDEEIYSAIAANVRNPYISEVHVLVEIDNPNLGCDSFVFAVMQTKFGQVCLNRTDDSFGASFYMGKLRCIRVSQQPTYKAMVSYANDHLTKSKGFLLSHADVVWDSTLRLLDLSVLRQGYAMIFSVMSAPQHGQYAHFVGGECLAGTERCSLGAAGFSWDAYLLPAPVNGELDIDFLPNRNGAENLAGYQFWKGAGLSLINPCLHVNAFHWHCKGTSSSVNHSGLSGRGVSNVFPCWDCRGVTAVSGHELCQTGFKVSITDSKLQEKIQNAAPAMPAAFHLLCCPSSVSCHDEIGDVISWVWKKNLCKMPEDVNCVLFAGSHERNPRNDYLMVPFR